MNLHIPQFKLIPLIGLYIGLFWLYRLVPQNWNYLQDAVSLLLLADLAAIFITGVRHLSRN